MKKLVSLLAFAICGSCGFAQEPVLSFDGDLYFIPGSMTKDGEAFLVSVNSYDHKGFTIYDGEFNTVREFTAPAMGATISAASRHVDTCLRPRLQWRVDNKGFCKQ